MTRAATRVAGLAALLTLTGCPFLPGDGVTGVRGAIVDAEGRRYTDCTLKLFPWASTSPYERRLSKGDVKTNGEFSERFVVAPGGGTYTLGVDCEGAAEGHVTQPFRTNSGGDTTDLGRIVLPRGRGG